MASHVVSARAVTAFRCVYTALLLAAVWYRQELNHGVTSLWDAMRASWLVQLDSFEPIVASVAFATWINLFRFADSFGGTLGLHRFRLLGPPKPDTLLGLDHGMQALLAYILPLAVFDVLVPRRTLPSEAPSFFGVLSQVCVSLFVYDFLFFWVHLALHRVRWLSRFHARHHFKSPMNASEVVRHSLVDGSLQVLCNIVTLNALRCHPMARILHNVVITYMLTETHSGYDMPHMLHNVVPGGLLGGSPRHEYHHRAGTAYYHQFFTYLDNWMGTVRKGGEPFRKPASGVALSVGGKGAGSGSSGAVHDVPSGDGDIVTGSKTVDAGTAAPVNPTTHAAA